MDRTPAPQSVRVVGGFTEHTGDLLLKDGMLEAIENNDGVQSEDTLMGLTRRLTRMRD